MVVRGYRSRPRANLGHPWTRIDHEGGRFDRFFGHEMAKILVSITRRLRHSKVNSRPLKGCDDDGVKELTGLDVSKLENGNK